MQTITTSLENAQAQVMTAIVPALIFAFLVCMLLGALTLFVPTFRENYAGKAWTVFAIACGTPLGVAFIPELWQMFGGN